MAERWTMSTVVPIGGNVTSALLLGWAWAVCLADELGDFGLALAVELAEDDEVDVDGPEAEADDEAVLWTVPDAVLAAELELDDPPHPASSSSSEPTPPATAHPLLRITPLSLRRPGTGPEKGSAGMVSRWSRRCSPTA
jgi:hypothetical protein